MKKAARVLPALAILVALAMPAGAVRVGTVVDYALYTDIVAQIDGHPLRSFNVNGHTAVVAEDLKRYGFYALWNGEDRTLKVERARETPANWPEYTPDPLKQPVGARAEAILATDIVATVAGRPVESFNINGETLIWFSDLAPYGEVTWDETARTAGLTLGDPMQKGLDLLIEDLERWKQTAGAFSSYELYPGDLGTLFLGYYSGTPHGGLYQMVFVYKNGNQLDVVGLLPHYGFGTGYYIQPREIQYEVYGHRLSFVTPVKEVLDEQSGTVKDWGDTLCTVDVNAGQIVSMRPLYGEAAQWDISCQPGLEAEGSAPGGTQISQNGLEIVLKKQDGKANVEILSSRVPSSDMAVSFWQDSICITHYAGMWDAEFEESVYGRAFQALRDLNLPDVAAEEFTTTENPPQQRVQAAQWFQVTKNGQPIAGNLWWGHGNNHTDLTFGFDAPVTMGDGDTLTLWVGVRET